MLMLMPLLLGSVDPCHGAWINQWRIQNVQEEAGGVSHILGKKGVLASLDSEKCMKMQYFHQ